MTRAERNIRWVEAMCRVPEGPDVGKPVRLREWQKAELRKLYDSPTSLFIISFGRKNGKTALVAFIVLLHTVGPEAVPNSEVVSGARSRDQASMVYRYAMKSARLSPDLNPYLQYRESAKEIICPELGTTYKALSADATTNIGRSPALAIHDELGQVRGPRDAFYDAIDTSQGAYPGALSIIVSTQAATDLDLLSVLIDDAKTGRDPTVKLSLYTAPEDADPYADESLKAANPAFGDFLDADYCRKQAEKARRMPSFENSYRNLILNQRVNLHTPFVPRSVWEACGSEPDEYAFQGRVFVAIDLSARNDLTAIVSLAEGEGGGWDIRPEFWTPEVGIGDRARRDGAPYDLWVKQGHMSTTPGASVDYDFIADRLVEIAAEAESVHIVADRWRLKELEAALSRRDADLEIEGFGQGFQSMAPALDALEAELLNKRLRHGNHPVLSMCAAHAVAVTNPAGDRKLDKSKATGRIDGMVALVMAMGAASANGSSEGDMDGFFSSPVRKVA